MSTARNLSPPQERHVVGPCPHHQLGARFRPRRAQTGRPAPAGPARATRAMRLSFPTQEAAIAYAEREGLAFTVVPAPTRTLKLQSYADNFR